MKKYKNENKTKRQISNRKHNLKINKKLIIISFHLISDQVVLYSHSTLGIVICFVYSFSISAHMVAFTYAKVVSLNNLKL